MHLAENRDDGSAAEEMIGKARARKWSIFIKKESPEKCLLHPTCLISAPNLGCAQI